MISVYSDDHESHSGLLEAKGDEFVASPECPERAKEIIHALCDAGLGEMRAPRSFDDRKLIAVHSEDYIRFLQSAWTDWTAEGRTGTNARPQAFVAAGMRHADTRSIVGRLGRYAFDDSAPLVAGSWQAIRTSADIAITAAEIVRMERMHAFALCRPPGHHASRTLAGGYCYLNNSAIAAQSMIDTGARKVAVLDVDYHHGNGTQSIFYERNDVMTVSLHADPAEEYPYFLGYEDEPGAGQGHGFNINFPLPPGTQWREYRIALTDALANVRRFSPDFLIVALGLDTFIDDPTTRFGLTTGDYGEMARLIAALGKPVLTVLEGGYDIDSMGKNAVTFLRGIDGN